MNSEVKPLSNLQLELLKIFSFDLEERQLLDIKEMLANYFADQATQEMDALLRKTAGAKKKLTSGLNNI